MATVHPILADRTRIGENGCIEWTGLINAGGYGRLRIGKGKKKIAHRYSYELIHGPVPKHLDVCHHCDNRRCINPDHLFVGTRLENIQDSARKGRQAQKLQPYQALAIKYDKRPGCVIAREYGVCDAVVSEIRSGKLWRHLP
jgi:HNH endonuclease